MTDPSRVLEVTSDLTLPGLLRCLKARRMRGEGIPDEEIALAIKLPVELVQVVIDAAEDRHPPVNGEDLTTAAFYNYQLQLDRLDLIAREPGFKHDVKGELVAGPDGEPEIDTERQIQAEREISRTWESIRRLMGSDAPQRRHLTIEEIQRKENVRMLAQQLTTAEIANLDIVDGEIVYETGGPSLQLGEGGLVRDDDREDSAGQ